MKEEKKGQEVMVPYYLAGSARVSSHEVAAEEVDEDHPCNLLIPSQNEIWVPRQPCKLPDVEAWVRIDLKRPLLVNGFSLETASQDPLLDPE